MHSGSQVICAGILVADHVCTPMERLPEPGHLIAVDRMFLFTGGCAANVAVNLSKQGIRVAAVGKVGDDSFGRFIRWDLSERGVDVSGVQTAPNDQTSQTMILLCRGQDRRFVHTFGANRSLTIADIDRTAWNGASVFYVGGYLVLPAFNSQELADLFRECRERGLRTVLDVVVPDDFTYQGELEAVLPYTDVFLPNDDEAKVLTGESDPALQAESLLAKGAGVVVITQGGNGVLWTDRSEICQASHFRSEVVDQSGAGDAFCAGFIAGMVGGMGLEGCIHYGSALGASCVRSIGCYEGVFTAKQAEEFLKSNRLEIRRLGGVRSVGEYA